MRSVQSTPQRVKTQNLIIFGFWLSAVSYKGKKCLDLGPSPPNHELQYFRVVGSWPKPF